MSAASVHSVKPTPAHTHKLTHMRTHPKDTHRHTTEHFRIAHHVRIHITHIHARPLRKIQLPVGTHTTNENNTRAPHKQNHTPHTRTQPHRNVHTREESRTRLGRRCEAWMRFGESGRPRNHSCVCLSLQISCVSSTTRTSSVSSASAPSHPSSSSWSSRPLER